METATLWTFELPEERDGSEGRWIELHHFMGRLAHQAAKAKLQSIKWRTAYGELFAITTGDKRPIKVDPRCYD